MADLTAKRRGNLSADKFAVPGKKKLPIEDASHARNAAARVNQTKGLTPSERATAERKIAAAEQKFGTTPQKGPASKKGKS